MKLALAAALAVSVATYATLEAQVDGPQEAARATGTFIRGPARVVDGDTLVVDGKRVRLFGIDAPEMGTTCAWPEPVHRGWSARAEDCGAVAAARLAGVTAQGVDCRVVDVDQYRRFVAVCTAPEAIAGMGRVELGGFQVAYGWALAHPVFGAKYRADQAFARRAGAGFWSCEIDGPAAWADAKDCP